MLSWRAVRRRLLLLTPVAEELDLPLLNVPVVFVERAGEHM
jgi:hypothetical protein